MSGEWRVEPPSPDPDDLFLSPENVERFFSFYLTECEGAWRDVEREVLTNPEAVNNLLNGEPLHIAIKIDFSSLAPEAA